MPQKTAVMIDASCELPRSFIDTHKLIVVPSKIKLGDSQFQDDRDSKKLLDFYQNLSNFNQTMDITSIDSEQASDFIKQKLIPKFESVQAITLEGTMSPFFKCIREVVQDNKGKFQEWRVEANQDPKFRMRVLDSESLFSGYGLIVYEAVRLLSEKAISVDKLKPALEGIKPKVETYLAIKDLDTLQRQSSKATPERLDALSLSWTGFQLSKWMGKRPVMRFKNGHSEVISQQLGADKAVASILKIAKSRIEKGLASPVINCSYSGNLAEIRSNPDFKEFQEFAVNKQIRVLTSMMSAQGAALAGPQAFSLSLINAR